MSNPSNSNGDVELQKLFYEHFNDDLLLVCGRVWEAWQVGTMTQDDFTRIDEDEFVLPELLAKLSSYVQTQRTQAAAEAIRAFGTEIRHLVEDFRSHHDPDDLYMQIEAEIGKQLSNPE